MSKHFSEAEDRLLIYLHDEVRASAKVIARKLFESGHPLRSDKAVLMRLQRIPGYRANASRRKAKLTVSVWVDRSMYDRLNDAAVSRMCSVSTIINEILERQFPPVTIP